MATYAIGDLQGCYDELQQLLEQIQFDIQQDQLWFVGDIVNRGPQSLECLRFVKSLNASAKIVLGNHDLSLIATAAGFRKPSNKDTLDPILNAPDRDELLNWLRSQPLLHTDSILGYTMIHAGLPPQWSIQQAELLAQEVSGILSSPDHPALLKEMYGNDPKQWTDNLKDNDRYRFIINALTRLRYCTKTGKLDLNDKGAPGSQGKKLMPWYQVPNRKSAGTKIVFGHWSTLGCVQENNIYSLDSGCVWGGQLSALRIDTEQPELISVQCAAKQPVN